MNKGIVRQGYDLDGNTTIRKKSKPKEMLGFGFKKN